MAIELGGLHHVTAITSDAPQNVAFYTDTLGLRLVKKTVNQDDVSAYHLFYADADGNAGTEVTFFDWAAVPRNRPGVGEIAALGLRVPDRETLEWWAMRFDDRGVAHGPIGERGGRAFLPFTDPEGQRLELVEDGAGVVLAPGATWADSPVPAERQIRGLSMVTLVVAELAPTAAVLTQVLGFRELARERGVDGGEDVVFEVGPGGRGRRCASASARICRVRGRGMAASITSPSARRTTSSTSAGSGGSPRPASA